MSTRARVCDVCGLPVAAADLVKVGACEFPFYVHEACREQMAPVAGFVEDLCRLADDQPAGLLWLGSWGAGDAEGDGGDERAGVAEGDGRTEDDRPTEGSGAVSHEAGDR